MTSTLQPTGVHHVSAPGAHLGRSHALHVRVPGLRPVTRSVNPDEPGMRRLALRVPDDQRPADRVAPLDGERLSLHPFLEPRRAESESRPTPLTGERA